MKRPTQLGPVQGGRVRDSSAGSDTSGPLNRSGGGTDNESARLSNVKSYKFNSV